MNSILKTIVDNLTNEERTELAEYLESCSCKGNVTESDNSQSDNESFTLKCPKCDSTGPLTEHYSTRTAVYYPPVWENGVNLNPDGNVTTTLYTCGKCGFNFSAQYQYGKLINLSRA